MHSPQYRVIETRLRQRTATRHTGKQRQQAAGGTQLTGQLVVCQTPRSASATELRQQLHWLPVRQRIYKLAVITYKT